MYICIRNKNKAIMTLTQVTKQIEKLENKISKLSRELNRTMKTETEMELNKQKEILFHLEKIQGLLS
jgi:TolA-binding protein